MNSVSYKLCTKCGKVKSVSEFGLQKRKESKDTLSSWCNKCKSKNASDYQKRHPDKQKLNSKLWRERHLEKAKEVSKRREDKWRKKYPEKALMRMRNYRARKKLAGGKISSKEWIELCNFYGNICLCCRKENIKLTLDHVIPLSLGGSNTIGNAQPLCHSCNSRKRNSIADYRPYLMVKS